MLSYNISLKREASLMLYALFLKVGAQRADCGTFYKIRLKNGAES
jgi:hypothetical protein